MRRSLSKRHRLENGSQWSVPLTDECHPSFLGHEPDIIDRRTIAVVYCEEYGPATSATPLNNDDAVLALPFDLFMKSMPGSGQSFVDRGRKQRRKLQNEDLQTQCSNDSAYTHSLTHTIFRRLSLESLSRSGQYSPVTTIDANNLLHHSKIEMLKHFLKRSDQRHAKLVGSLWNAPQMVFRLALSSFTECSTILASSMTTQETPGAMFCIISSARTAHCSSFADIRNKDVR